MSIVRNRSRIIATITVLLAAPSARAGGFRFQLTDALAVQSGLRYDRSTLPDSKRTVAFPINRSYTTSAGVLYDWSESLRLAVAFTWVNYGDAPVNRPTVKGDYSSNDVYAVAISLVWKQLPWSGWAKL